MFEYISAPEAAKKWGISERRVQKLCEDGRILGVAKFSRMWICISGCLRGILELRGACR